VTKDNPGSFVTPVGLARFSVVVVVAVLGLITVGGLVTSWNAGMAVPDWPLSFGSLNPSGWWADFAVRLEHGHRLYAAMVGMLVGVLVAWIHGNFKSLGVALLIGLGVGLAGRLAGFSAEVKMHLGLWCPAVGFVGVLLLSGVRQSSWLVWLSRVAFLLVCLQATLGGLRVTQETAGSIDVALILRVFHGCVAQVFLGVLVAICVLLHRGGTFTGGGRAARWLLLGGLFFQLVLGATIRHKGAGLAIPTFPSAGAGGSWLPSAHGFLVDLHFTHSRVLPMVIVALVLWVWGTDVQRSASARGWRSLPLVLVVVQVCLGISVIWSGRLAGVTTLHVLTGAALLASVVANLCLDAICNQVKQREGGV
jgi:cytochrome c oxidase assembly protein subunit 15